MHGDKLRASAAPNMPGVYGSPVKTRRRETRRRPGTGGSHKLLDDTHFNYSNQPSLEYVCNVYTLFTMKLLVLQIEIKNSEQEPYGQIIQPSTPSSMNNESMLQALLMQAVS